VLADYDGEVSYEALMNMEYAGRVISESLRKYTPGNVLMRKCTKEYKIADTDITIEKGRMVFLPMHAIHTDPEFFPEPEKFDPDRFTPEMEKERNPFTYLPFGEGQRICMGLRFGLIQTRLGLVSVLRKYRVTLNEKTVHPIRLDPKDVTMMPYGGIWLNTERI
jgi:cytochrome P450 family 6